MVDEGADKARRVMACAAVLRGRRMIRRLAVCRGAIVAGGAGLRHGVEHRVVETTAQVERSDVMTHGAIHGGEGMAH